MFLLGVEHEQKNGTDPQWITSADRNGDGGTP